MSQERDNSMKVSVSILSAEYLLLLGELLDLWMTVKSFPEIPTALDTAFLYHNHSPAYFFFFSWAYAL